MTCNECGKTCHDSKRAALAHIKNLAERRNRKPSGGVYKCPHCGYFHITSSKTVRILKTVRREKQGIVRRATLAEKQRRKDFTKYEVKISI